MSVRILHLADLHLGAAFPSMGERGSERSRDLLNAFLRAIEYAAHDPRPVDLVVIAGDLFDTHDPEEGLVVQVESALERLATAAVPVLIVPGTHDALTYRRSVYRRLRVPQMAHVFLSPRLEPGPQITVGEETVQTYGIAFDPSVTARPLEGFQVSGISDYHVAILHGALQDNPAWKIRPTDLPVTRAEIAASKLHYLALGHYHNPAEVREGSTVAVYPGTLEGKRFGENGPRHLVTATLSAKGVAVERTPWNVRTLHEAVIDLGMGEIKDESQLESRLVAFAGDREIARIRLEGPADFAFDAERIQTRLAPRFFHFEIEDRSYIVNASLLGRYREEATVRGVFVRRMLERIEQAPDPAGREVAALALRLGLAEFQNPRHAP
jgi:DNA repair protein SbcD/Mre11